MTMQPRTIPHHYLRQLLSEGRVVQITFKKKDGTDRQMTGTTNLALVGDNKPKFVRATSPDVVALFDLDCMEWRSLRADTEIELHGSYYPSRGRGLFDVSGCI
jgi:hypothetical protein